MNILANLGQENRGTGMCILAGFNGTQHISISLVFQKPGDSTFSTLLTGPGTQHMSQKSGCPAKNGTFGMHDFFSLARSFIYFQKFEILTNVLIGI